MTARLEFLDALALFAENADANDRELLLLAVAYFEAPPTSRSLEAVEVEALDIIRDNASPAAAAARQ